jgi:uncharacterized membrane protein YebE (DUF533 family)
MAEISHMSKLFGGYWFLKWLIIASIIGSLLALMFANANTSTTISGTINLILLVSMAYNYYWIYNPWQEDQRSAYRQFQRDNEGKKQDLV